jgi:hypothetical protein
VSYSYRVPYRYRRRGGSDSRGLLIAVVVLAALVAASAGRHGISLGRGTAAGAAGYVNPLAGQSWGLARTDQGVDYVPDAPEAVRAIGAGTVVYSSTATGWPGGAFISYRLAGGPAAGAVVYVAEHLTGLVRPGTAVRAGEPIATAWPGYPWTEWGWAACGTDLPAVQYNGAPDGTPMAGGLAFARFMRGLGAGTAQDPGAGPDVVRGC